MNNLIGIKEAALLLGVNTVTLRRWDKQGILKAARFGKRNDRKYSEQQLQEFSKHQEE